jgi:Putative MetA-pathway of phenol degradation
MGLFTRAPRRRAFAALMSASIPAWAGPPFVTDDPEPVEHRHWEINSAVAATWSHGEMSAGVPSVDVNYGIAPNVQLHAQPRYSYERSAQDARSGLDDTEVGVKYRFLNVERDDSKTMVGIYPMYQLPTGDAKLGPSRGKRQIFLPVWVQRDSGKWTMYGGAGYRINPGIGNRNSQFLGATALYQVTQSLQLGGEMFHETPNAVDGRSTAAFNLGGVYKLLSRCNVLFSAGRTLRTAGSANQISAYLALQLLY